MNFEIHNKNCIDGMRAMPDNSVDSIVTDPPYEIGFMGKSWDSSGIAYSIEMWREAMRVLKPGGHLLAFSGSRTYHRMTCAIEDAGFEVRDQIMWVYGSGFPKSLDVSKAIDKVAGAEREVVGVRQDFAARANVQRVGVSWADGSVADGSFSNPQTVGLLTAPATEAAKQWQGWGTALKPAHEPICVARKPLVGTVAANVLQHGTGAINVDGCRVGNDIIEQHRKPQRTWREREGRTDIPDSADFSVTSTMGRWPANLIHDGSDEVVSLFPESNGSGPARKLHRSAKPDQQGWGMNVGAPDEAELRDAGTGSAARFFYCAKTSKRDRGEGNDHPTVKPNDLMRYLCRLVTPPGGLVLDPFTGSGSTGKAAVQEGFRFIGFELNEHYAEVAKRRIEEVEPDEGEPAIPLDSSEPVFMAFDV